jgi:hypothetical protein
VRPAKGGAIPVFVPLKDRLLVVRTSEDETDPMDLCPGQCYVCEYEMGLEHCPRDRRLYEQMADSWMFRELMEELQGQ